MKVYYFENSWQLNEKHAKKIIKNNKKFNDHSVQAFYLKSEVDAMIKRIEDAFDIKRNK
jgi:hypothetical protein